VSFGASEPWSGVLSVDEYADAGLAEEKRTVGEGDGVRWLLWYTNYVRLPPSAGEHIAICFWQIAIFLNHNFNAS